ncbi:MAG: tetratricopeptide repeat protein [Acidobacteria bacterium]|nr:tetratricopeptide repeat protein [Acidobacteriota bacterium]
MTSEESSSPCFVFGEFRLDRSILEFRGERVPLSPKALDTLFALVESAGEVVDKDALMQRVWPDTYVAESGLARNISVLRKTLAEHGGPEPYIETISKRGYRFVAPVSAAPPEAAAPRPEAVAPALEEAPVGRPAGLRLLGPAAVGMLLAAAAWLYWGSPAGKEAAKAESAPYRIGLHLLEKRTPVEAEKALASFRRAVEIEPESAEAHAALANVYLASMQLGVPERFVGEFRNQAIAEADRAVELNPESASALAASGAVRLFLEWDFEGAEQALGRALQVDPEHEMALFHWSRLQALRRNFPEAIEAAQRAQRVNPVSAMLGDQEGIVYYQQGDMGKAVEAFHRVLERERNDAIAHYYLALSYGFLQSFARAREHLAQAELAPTLIATDSAWLDLMEGDREPMARLRQAMKGRIAAGEITPDSLMVPAVALGEMDEAIGALEAALGIGSASVLEMRLDPRLEPLRRDGRYEAVMRQGGIEP